MSTEIQITGIEKVGKRLMEGFLSTIMKYFLWWVGVMLVFYVVSGFTGWGRDDSDPSRWKASGFRILTDSRTGLQYLSDGKGGLILRVDANGKPIR